MNAKKAGGCFSKETMNRLTVVTIDFGAVHYVLHLHYDSTVTIIRRTFHGPVRFLIILHFFDIHKSISDLSWQCRERTTSIPDRIDKEKKKLFLRHDYEEKKVHNREKMIISFDYNCKNAIIDQ